MSWAERPAGIVGMASLAGFVMWALLLPWGGCVDIDPILCSSMFGWYTVPDQWVAWVAGAATAAAVGLLLWLRGRRS